MKLSEMSDSELLGEFQDEVCRGVGRGMRGEESKDGMKRRVALGREMLARMAGRGIESGLPFTLPSQIEGK